jgi:hypothetical protein
VYIVLRRKIDTDREGVTKREREKEGGIGTERENQIDRQIDRRKTEEN